MSILSILYDHCKNKPKDTAFFIPDNSHQLQAITYEQLYEQATIIANWLLTRNVEKGDRVLLIYPHGIDFIFAFFACLEIGAIAVPSMPPRGPAGKMKFKKIVEDCRPKAILPVASELTNVKIIPGKKSEVFLDDVAMLQYTSGSTGDPKGVMITHRNLLSNLDFIKDFTPRSQNRLGISWLPLFHDMGLIGGILNPIHQGYPCILMSPLAFLKNPLKWLQLISEYKATGTPIPPFALQYCLDKIKPEDCQELDLRSLNCIMLGSEPIHPEVLNQFSSRFMAHGFNPNAYFPCYGLAEATLLVTCKMREKPHRNLSVNKGYLSKNTIEICQNENTLAMSIMSCGQPAQEIAIIDPETHQRVPGNKIGEIWVTGPSVAKGYWEKNSSENNPFKAKIKSEPQTEYFRTGDLGFLYQGELYITGRLKDLIIIRGENYYPHDIEYTAYSSCGKIKPNGVAAISRLENGVEKFTLLCELDDQADHEEYPRIIQKIRGAISYAYGIVPDEILLVATKSLPKTSSGKLRRSSIFTLLDSSYITIFHRFANLKSDIPLQENIKNIENLSDEEILRALHSLLEEVFPGKCLAPPKMLDPVENLGLSSIEFMELIYAIEKTFNRNLGISELLEAHFISDLVTLVKSSDSKIIQNQSDSISHTKTPYFISKRLTEFFCKVGMRLKYHLFLSARQIIKSHPSQFIKLVMNLEPFFPYSLKERKKIAKKSLWLSKIHYSLTPDLNHQQKYYSPKKYFPYSVAILDYFFRHCEKPCLMINFHTSGWNRIFPLLLAVLKMNTTLEISIIGGSRNAFFPSLQKEFEFHEGLKWDVHPISKRIHYFENRQKNLSFQLLKAIKEKHIIFSLIDPIQNLKNITRPAIVPIFDHQFILPSGLFDWAERYKIPVHPIEFDPISYFNPLKIHPAQIAGLSGKIKPLLDFIQKKPYLWALWWNDELKALCPPIKSRSVPEASGRIINKNFHLCIELSHYVLIYNWINRRIVQLPRKVFALLRKEHYPLDMDKFLRQCEGLISPKDLHTSLGILRGEKTELTKQEARAEVANLE